MKLECIIYCATVYNLFENIRVMSLLCKNFDLKKHFIYGLLSFHGKFNCILKETATVLKLFLFS